ncbi:hypothetical protein [Methylobacterium brachythecii]|uniref:Uncharacterized protein n=1 Tax=Methylobacterium brachythecii TaxID=1176177 RepID=A0A7W6F894_9HYPH|nr:hypothetical protein [Methylobacterium brachythecii]MBB3904218.1 hypothetical protein [Methylobacterium brachythecii]GLS45119.1 hypothetical protein GCM10007884_31080 [Methylobacterium brachythecii]
MPDRFLIGNGLWCSCCFPAGAPRSRNWRKKIRPGCNECAGEGRISLTAEQIIAATIAETVAWRARA